MVVNWNEEKNKWLKKNRDISFEDVEIAIKDGKVLAISEHPNKSKYPNQKILVVEILFYAYIVPYVENDEEIFFKTIIPSRKFTKEYLFKNINE